MKMKHIAQHYGTLTVNHDMHKLWLHLRMQAEGWPGGGRVDRPPKVCDLQFSIRPQKQIFRFNVSMNHVLGVTVVQGVSELHYILQADRIHTHYNQASCINHELWSVVSHRGTPLVIEGPAALELSIQLSFRSELQDEVNARRVVEVTVQTQDIGMSGRDGEFTTHRN